MKAKRSDRVAAHNLQLRLRHIHTLFNRIADDYDFDPRLTRWGQEGVDAALAAIADITASFPEVNHAQPVRKVRLSLVG